ncbi:non-ribosomal peptide synthetase [Xenorhabdus doucetiae]|uniref:Amino acid adenylation domain-containing protein n=1 Tax=Xenorhabdus doucetiae TaxID=351671 RepID=A0A068QX61_9GAMM|nr:AMP-binding protein [Xenorhabdus doucetiae]TYO94672.1 amino acid adenylation domain-containing protein [Xenorhabdus doucetiae]CDG19563.1 Complete genome; segment 9/17 [Xenorhabdus doucetiae]
MVTNLQLISLEYLITISDIIEYVEGMSDSDSDYLYVAEPRKSESSNISYIVYTSGSTGKPKGVMISHNSIINQLSWLKKEGFLGVGKSIIHKTPISFDAAQWEMLSICCGSKIVVSNFSINKNVDNLIDDIIDNNISLIQCVPTLLQALVNRKRFDKCFSLSHILCGGESLTKKLALQCLNTLPNCELINVYGPAECTCNASFYNVSIDIKKEHNEGVSIGQPVDNTEFYVLDEVGVPVCNGNIGELHISGAQIARGYLNQNDLTNQRFFSFIPPCSNIPTIVYKTGDLVYQDKNGEFYFIGRKDSQVKIRGMRVELEEIKIELEALLLINTAAVINKVYIDDQYILIAYIELNKEGVTLEEKRTHQDLIYLIKSDLSKRLPDYMIPGLLIFVDIMPLTITGKIDFHMLEKLGDKHYGKENIAPRSINEKKIQDIWIKHLKNNNISIDDDFFSLGGDSLSAVDIILSINKEFGSNLPLHILFEVSTIEKLTCLISTNSNEISSRLISLQTYGELSPIFCWPGLGGYPMSLKLLAEKIGKIRPFYGIQASGLNEGEQPYNSLQKAVSIDIVEIINKQPQGPYVLWGYSFGTISAFEAAYQLEMMGEEVEELILIAPGMTKGYSFQFKLTDEVNIYENKEVVSLLFSVFSRDSNHPELSECLRTVTDEESFIKFIRKRNHGLSHDLIRKISRVVIEMSKSLQSDIDSIFYNKRISAPVKIFSAEGDQLSYFETNNDCFVNCPDIYKIESSHFELLKESGVANLLSNMRMLISWM